MFSRYVVTSTLCLTVLASEGQSIIASAQSNTNNISELTFTQQENDALQFNKKRLENAENWKAIKKQLDLLKEHEDFLIQYLATYTNSSVAELQKLQKELNGKSLHFLIKASVISKISQTSINNIITDLNKGINMREIAQKNNVDKEKFKKELNAVTKDILKKLEKE